MYNKKGFSNIHILKSWLVKQGSWDSRLGQFEIENLFLLKNVCHSLQIIIVIVFFVYNIHKWSLLATWADQIHGYCICINMLGLWPRIKIFYILKQIYVCSLNFFIYSKTRYSIELDKNLRDVIKVYRVNNLNHVYKYKC